MKGFGPLRTRQPVDIIEIGAIEYDYDAITMAIYVKVHSRTGTRQKDEALGLSEAF
jgi:hypothetical protein